MPGVPNAAQPAPGAVEDDDPFVAGVGDVETPGGAGGDGADVGELVRRAGAAPGFQGLQVAGEDGDAVVVVVDDVDARAVDGDPERD